MKIQKNASSLKLFEEIICKVFKSLTSQIENAYRRPLFVMQGRVWWTVYGRYGRSPKVAKEFFLAREAKALKVLFSFPGLNI